MKKTLARLGAKYYRDGRLLRRHLSSGIHLGSGGMSQTCERPEVSNPPSRFESDTLDFNFLQPQRPG